jgi:hypothetical protein
MPDRPHLGGPLWLVLAAMGRASPQRDPRRPMVWLGL